VGRHDWKKEGMIGGLLCSVMQRRFDAVHSCGLPAMSCSVPARLHLRHLPALITLS